MGKVQVGASRGEVGYQASTISQDRFSRAAAAQNHCGASLPGPAGQGARRHRAGGEILRAVPRYARQFLGARPRCSKSPRSPACSSTKQAETLGDEIRKSVTDPGNRPRRAAANRRPGLVPQRGFREGDRAVRRRDQGKRANRSCSPKPGCKRATLCSRSGQWDGAVLAYLHVPVFYEDEKLWMPQALLGSARAFRGLEDLDRAKKSLNDLTAAISEIGPGGNRPG